MPELDTSVCLDSSAIKSKAETGGRFSAPESTFDSVRANVSPRSPALRYVAQRFDALPLRQTWLTKPWPLIPCGLARARHWEPIGRRICV